MRLQTHERLITIGFAATYFSFLSAMFSRSIEMPPTVRGAILGWICLPIGALGALMIFVAKVSKISDG